MSWYQILALATLAVAVGWMLSAVFSDCLASLRDLQVWAVRKRLGFWK